jgi:hypothetical protein
VTTIYGDGTSDTTTTNDVRTCASCGGGGGGGENGGDGGICSIYPEACQIRNTPALPGVAIGDLYVGN